MHNKNETSWCRKHVLDCFLQRSWQFLGWGLSDWYCPTIYTYKTGWFYAFFQTCRGRGLLSLPMLLIVVCICCQMQIGWLSLWFLVYIYVFPSSPANLGWEKPHIWGLTLSPHQTQQMWSFCNMLIIEIRYFQKGVDNTIWKYPITTIIPCCQTW